MNKVILIFIVIILLIIGGVFIWKWPQKEVIQDPETINDSSVEFIYAKHDDNYQNIVIYLHSSGYKEEITSILGDLLTGVKGRVSPDGANLLLTSYNTLNAHQAQEKPSSLLLVNLSTKEIYTVFTPNSGEWINDFIWASDGRVLFYTLETFSESKGIWVYDLETKQHSLLVSGEELDARAPVSFLGNTIHNDIYLSLESGFIISIWHMNRDGSALKKVYSPLPATTILPALSPDGREIVYYVYGENAVFANIIQVVNIETQEKRDLLTIAPETLLPYTPLWSPDGQQILYGYLDNFWLVDVNDNKNQKLISIDQPPMQPLSWSPNGSFIAIAKYQTGLRRGRDLYNVILVDQNNGEVRNAIEGDIQFVDWLP